jgi:hypothetical protein
VVTASARSQLAAIWTEWLGPLTARNEALARENGELRAERDAAAAERDWLRSERDRDHRLADQLVDLLQADRDEAWARVAALEGAPGPPADAGLVLVPAAGVLGRVVGTIGRAVTAARSRR